MSTPPGAPTAAPAERVRQALQERESTDYVFDFWTALGWTILTFGIYGLYVFYQLVRRSRDHNRRRVELLGAAYEAAWERASAAGRAEELRPRFERVAADLEPLHRMTGDFRDPAVWLVLELVGGWIVWVLAFILLDQDLVKHERQERAVEQGLTALFAELGGSLPAPVPAAKRPHSYVGRIVASVFTFGLYAFWWTNDLMREGNANFAADRAWEDAVALAVGA